MGFSCHNCASLSPDVNLSSVVSLLVHLVDEGVQPVTGDIYPDTFIFGDFLDGSEVSLPRHAAPTISIA